MIFVLGSTGIAGSQLVPVLLKRGAQVRVGVHAGRKNLIYGDDQVEHVPINYEDAGSLRNAFAGCDALYLLTPFGIDQASTEERIANIAVAAGVKRIVKQSVIGVDAGHIAPVAEIHRRIEGHISRLDVEWTFLEPAPFMQDLVFHQGDTIRHESRLVAIAGEEPVAYLDARDLASVAAEALLTPKHSGMVYPLTGPEMLTHAQLAERLSRQLGRPIQLDEVPASDAQRQLRQLGFSESAITTLRTLHPLAARGAAATIVSVVEEVTGHASISLQAFLNDYAEAFEPFVEPSMEEHHGAPRYTTEPSSGEESHP